MDLHTVLRVFRERWRLIAIATVVSLLAGTVVTIQQTPLYTAKVTLFVSAWGTGDATSTAYQGSLFSQQRVKSYARLIRGELVMTAVKDQLKLDMGPRQLAGEIQASAVPDTVLLATTVTDPSARRAQAIANATAEQFIKLVPVLESTGEGKQAPVRVTIIDSADLPTAPTSPQPLRNMAMALLIGLMLGAAVAAARNTLDTTVKSAQQVTDISNATSLGIVWEDPNATKVPLVINDGPYAPRAEAFRKIRTCLQFVDVDKAHKVVLVTSAVSGEGKSSTACNLATTLAEAGRRVILIDGDLRRPRAAKYLGLPSGVGLTNVLVGYCDVAAATQTWGENLMSVLASGPIPPNPSELLGSRQMKQLLTTLREQYDNIVIDGPPLLPVADAAATAPLCDGAVLVVRHGKTRKEQVQNAVASLRSVDANLLGTVLNRVPANKKQQSYYYYDNYGPQAEDQADVASRKAPSHAVSRDRQKVAAGDQGQAKEPVWVGTGGSEGDW